MIESHVQSVRQRYLLECAFRVLHVVRGLTLPTSVIHIFRVFRLFRSSKFRCPPSAVRGLTFPNPCRSVRIRGSTAMVKPSTINSQPSTRHGGIRKVNVAKCR